MVRSPELLDLDAGATSAIRTDSDRHGTIQGDDNLDGVLQESPKAGDERRKPLIIMVSRAGLEPATL